MRVYDVNLTSSSAAGSGRTQETQGSGQAGATRTGSAAHSSGDRVEFSSALGHISRALAADDAQRSSRVQALAAQYQSGTYRADPAATSRAMIADALSAGKP